MARLPVTNRYTTKDQEKSDRATKFIGRGSPASSTRRYAQAWGELANCGRYAADDRVFVSAEGNRRGRVAPDFDELALAVQAGAAFITDTPYHRGRGYNVGEREVAEFLMRSGYVEISPGYWTPRR